MYHRALKNQLNRQIIEGNGYGSPVSSPPPPTFNAFTNQILRNSPPPNELYTQGNIVL